MPGNEGGYQAKETIHAARIEVYNRTGLIERKLNAIVGPSRRSKARDVYDLVWLRAAHRTAIGAEQIGAMSEWRARMRLNNATNRELAREFHRDRALSETSLDELLECYDQIVAKERSMASEQPAKRSMDIRRSGTGRARRDHHRSATRTKGQDDDIGW